MPHRALSLLIVEDDPAHAETVCRRLEASERWADIEVVATLRAYRERIKARLPSLVLMDMNLPDGQALEALAAPEEERPFPILIMTAHRDEKTTVAAMKAGALDYIVKSAETLVDVPHALDRALREWRLMQRHQRQQADILRTSQLASLGEFAAGVAHEINNPINGVINYAQLLANHAAQSDENRDLAERIIREGERIAAIVRSLLDFARPHQETKKPEDLKAILQETLVLVGGQLQRDGIHLRMKLAPDLPRIPLLRQQLQQVFVNLVSNARHALNERYPGAHADKVLVIRGAPHPRNNPVCLRLSFRDQGTGIPKEIRDRLFNPFFTTKPPERGTGLGLSISYGIIRNHGGSLRIHSETGAAAFTEVIIELPLGANHGA